jgi:hypothetical protein
MATGPRRPRRSDTVSPREAWSGSRALAGRIQQSFLPPSMPVVPRTRFAVHYQPCGRVGGDFYDVFRLDESHVAGPGRQAHQFPPALDLIVPLPPA